MKNTINTLCALIVCSGINSFAQVSTWYEVATPVEERLNDIEMVDASTGYIAGENGTLLKSTDGGFTWNAVNFIGVPAPFNTTGNFVDIEFVDAMNGYLVIANHSSIYYTYDGGSTWFEVTNSTTNQCFPMSVYTNTASDIFVGGSDCFQGATINHVVNNAWSVQTVNYETFDTQHFVTDIDFDDSLGLAAVNNEYILRSTDAGVTWDSINANIGSGNNLTSIFIASNDTCYAGYDQNGGGFGILYSADNGLTWQEDINSATFAYPAYYGFTENASGKVFCAAESSGWTMGMIFETSGSGWYYMDVDQPVYAMDSYDDVSFAVGDSGYVVTNTDPLIVGTLESSDVTISVYPNPVRDVLQIDCGSCTVGSVRIVSAYGQVVREIKGVTQEIVVSDLPDGMYFVEMQTSVGKAQEAFIKQ